MHFSKNEGTDEVVNVSEAHLYRPLQILHLVLYNISLW